MRNDNRSLMRRLNITKRKMFLFVIDMFLCYLALWISFILRYDFYGNPNALTILVTFGPILMLTAGPAYIINGFYSQMWRYASITQYFKILVGTTLHALAIYAIMHVLDIPLLNTYYIIFLMTSFMLIVGGRIIFRFLVNHETINLINPRRHQSFVKRNPELAQPIRVLVIGAGHAGNHIIRELLEMPSSRVPLALIDDNPDKHGLNILGIPVVGGRERILQTVEDYAINEIILAIPSASTQSIRDLVEICSVTQCQMKILPMLSEIIGGKVSIADIKEVNIEDLLGRQVIKLKCDLIADYLTDEVVMVTGGGGSIGSELCRQIARFHPKKLIVFDIYENNAFQLQHELLALYKNELDLVVLIGSVRDIDRLDFIMKEYKPGVIFHAAAHKHVPLMEDSPGEAVKNNIYGTYNVAVMAARNHVRRFVLISTDKAVNPTNVMGATKRIAELTIQTLSNLYPLTKFAGVRFGNVLGSNGSVIPLFKEQIRRDRCITVTHPDITRYFMTIPEAAQLVIQAGVLARGGEIFVLDMGKPVRILDLAKDLIRLSGLQPDVDVQIRFTGLRPGEKMYEDLFMDMESMDRTIHEMIFVMKPIADQAALQQELHRLRQIIRWSDARFDRLIMTLTNREIPELAVKHFDPAYLVNNAEWNVYE